ncbi:MAG: hypothetical protein J6X38_03780 [Abditibacteriota bacterium]|nr:hypothetical protein [Abditibacteriota bacterium]
MNTKIKNFITALLTTIALRADIFSGAGLPKCLNCFDAVSALLTFALFMLYDKVFFKKRSFGAWLAVVPSLIIALCLIFGESFDKTNSSIPVMGSKAALIVSLLRLIGFTAIFSFFFTLGIEKALSVRFRRKDRESLPFKSLWLIVFLCHLPYLPGSFPGVVFYDTLWQLEECVGNMPLECNNPLLSTGIMYAVFKPFSLLGNNFGVFMITLIQAAAFSAVIAFVLMYLARIGVKRYVRIGLLALYALCPVFAGSSVIIGKDTNYSFMLMLFTVFVIEILRKPENILKNRPRTAAFCVVIVRPMFLRNNGAHVVIPTLILLALVKRSEIKKLGLIFLCAVIAFNLFHKVLIPVTGIHKGSVREMMSVPFMQTARDAKMFPGEITAKEKAAIDEVLDADSIAAKYDPRIADEVKATFRNDATKEEIAEYVKVWKTRCVRRPGVALAAWWNIAYPFLCAPDAYMLCSRGIADEEVLMAMYDRPASDAVLRLGQPAPVAKLGKLIDAFIKLFKNIPVLCVLGQAATYFYLILFACFAFIATKRYKYLTAAVPALLSVAVCMASPVFGTRYALPYICAAPILFALIFRGTETGAGEEK